jgi:hypothetical protein
LAVHNAAAAQLAPRQTARRSVAAVISNLDGVAAKYIFPIVRLHGLQPGCQMCLRYWIYTRKYSLIGLFDESKSRSMILDFDVYDAL